MKRKIIGFILILAFMSVTFYESQQFFKGHIFAQNMDEHKISEVESQKRDPSNLTLETNTNEVLYTETEKYNYDENHQLLKTSKELIENQPMLPTLGVNQITGSTMYTDGQFELSGTPQIQKIKIGEDLSNDLKKLFKNISDPTTKLKEPVKIDSTKIGFQWVTAILINSKLNEKKVEIPVSVYDAKTTIFDEINHIAFDVKEIDFSLNELIGVNNENQMNEYIVEKMTKIWRMDTGEENPVEHQVTFKNYTKLNYGEYDGELCVSNSEIGAKNIKIKNLEPLEEGWEIGSNKDFILDNDYKIEWKDYVTDLPELTPETGPGAGSWWYNYKGKEMFYTIGAALIINDNFLPGTNDKIDSYPMDQKGFLWQEYEGSTYYINREKKSLKRTFQYLDDYKIEIIQQLLEDNAAEITYRVTNLSNQTQKIGISQNSSLFDSNNENDKPKVRPISGFKGVNIDFKKQQFMMFPDPETMPNWTMGMGYMIGEFNYFNEPTSTGIGWETGKRYRDENSNQLPKPIELRENEIVKDTLGVDGIGMKNSGVTVAPMKNASFKQKIKYGALIPPDIKLDQDKAAIYQHESFEITGEISDDDNKNYSLYLVMDDKENTMIKLKEFTDIPYKETQAYQVKIEGKSFSPGKHTVSIVGVDEYGARSAGKKIDLTIKELNATPSIQKVKVGEQLSNDLNVLFQEIRGENVTLKNQIVIDSGKIGFQWVEAILTNGEIERTLQIPVNVYNSESTHFNTEGTIALDAKKTCFGLSEVEHATLEGTLDELVRTKVAPLSWDMTNGVLLPVELISTDIKPVFGNYVVIFKAINQETGETFEKESQLMVDGELKFKELPKKLSFKDTTLSNPLLYVEREKEDWEIEIENTIESHWKLYLSGGSFENQGKENSKLSLLFKDSENNEVIINHQAQEIASGDKENYATIQWDKKQGLLLKVNSDTKIGVFQSEINWTLSDAPS
ncbi:hypothetical protein [Carnobacterium maltaromaticum]|uniref:hypothetical protein n=1 Tax=Carnobacterium maltaromaticum TaxID=2751 RepID=UPI0039BE38BD